MLAFEEYTDQKDQRPVSQWIDGLCRGNQEKVEQFMRIARCGDFKSPRFRKYETKAKDPNLYEARWTGLQRVPHRIFCYPTDKARTNVVLLCGFIHKDEQLVPRNAYGRAVKYRKELKDKEATTHEFTLGQIEQQGG